jgi:excisionase family DNA binding protein
MQRRATSVQPTEKSYGAVMPAHPVLVSPLSTVRQPEPFVNADTAAAFVGITRRTLLQKVRAGRIPGHALDCGAKKKEWRFKLSELDRYLCSAINSVLQPPEPANRRI